jgi:LysM repeat protein
MAASAILTPARFVCQPVPLTASNAAATIPAAADRLVRYGQRDRKRIFVALRIALFMKQNALFLPQSRHVGALLVLLTLAACAPPTPDSPRPTAAVVLDITVAPTQDVDATATAYARQLVPTPTPAGLYVVQQGDTLGGLAEDFGTTVEDLMAANGLTDANAIQAGQTLLIPSLISGTLALGTPAPLAGTLVPTTTATLTTTAILAPTGQISAPTSPTEVATPTLGSP